MDSGYRFDGDGRFLDGSMKRASGDTGYLMFPDLCLYYISIKYFLKFSSLVLELVAFEVERNCKVKTY